MRGSKHNLKAIEELEALKIGTLEEKIANLMVVENPPLFYNSNNSI